MKKIFVLLLFMGCLQNCSSSDSDKKEIVSPNKPAVKTYKNPVFAQNAPDPSVVRGGNGVFYAFSGGSVLESSDLVRWIRKDRGAFDVSPSWLSGGDVWASDVTESNGQYLMYYALSKWGEHWKNGIGVAVASLPQGPYTDKGKLFTSESIDVGNSIDPHFYEENGIKYLSWGSFYGLYAVELTADGFNIKPGSEKKKLAGNAFEAIMIHKHGDYYYLFASIGTCCEELKSTYTTVVGRSDNYWGPYVNKKGERMLDNKYEVVIAKDDFFVGTGHNSEIITDDNGNDWIMYHAYNASNIPAGRVLLLDQITWTDDWPEVKGGHASSTTEEAPYFK